jgi:hypothetical protein
MSNSLDRFHAMMTRNKKLVTAFNKFADSKDVVLFEDRSRVEHEQGRLMVVYSTIDARFAFSAEVPDEKNDLEYYFHEALTSARAMPHNFLWTTQKLTESEERRWREAVEAASKIVAPLAMAVAA